MSGSTAQLRQTLWIALLIAAWSGCPPALADDPPGTGLRGPGTFNATPLLIPAQDRSAIEAEVAAVMAMTPPDRRVMAELPSGSRLRIRPGAYEYGPSGSDCRPFDYEFSAVGGGVAVVIGRRCWFPAAADWLPVSDDVVVSTAGIVPVEVPAAAETMIAPAPPPPLRETAPPQAETDRARQPQNSATAPPSRIILPFVPSR